MFHQKLIFVLLVNFGRGDETGHWCKGESQRNYEVIVSPRLVDSVPCLELYRSGKLYNIMLAIMNRIYVGYILTQVFSKRRIGTASNGGPCHNL